MTAYGLEKSLSINHACSVVMDNPELAFGEVEICCFSYNGESLDYVGLMRRSIKVATAKYNLKFFRMLRMPSLSLTDLPPDPYFYPSPLAVLQTHMIRTANDTETRMLAETWSRFIYFVKAQRPNQAAYIDDLEQLRRLSHQQLDSIGYSIIKEEKEATLLALKLFGADYEDILSYWVADQVKPVPYLSGLNKGNRSYEDQAIQSDIVNSAKKIVPDALLNDFDASVHGLFRIKKKNGDTLSMINVNRVGLEKTTGADLIYYDNTYRSHIMIQYKMMTTEALKRENEKGKKKEPKDLETAKIYYYSPDDKFLEQVARMKAFQERIAGNGTALTDTRAYRLDSNWFYFKFCDPYEFKPVSSDLADGVYIPLEYMTLLLESPEVQGPKGGIKITKHNIGRHFSNTTFKWLLEEGLIGSYPETSDQIFAEVEQSLGNSRSVTLAWKNLL
jgi:hypothetical protein